MAVARQAGDAVGQRGHGGQISASIHDFDQEGDDRKNFKLPYSRDELIQRIVAANPKTIVVLVGTPVETYAWLDKVPSV